MNILETKKSLTEKELLIFQAEILKNKKRTGIAYLLFLLLGLIGIHKFYIGKKIKGLWYIMALALMWFFVLLTILGIKIGILVLLPLFLLINIGFNMIYDLFTIPSQVKKKNNEIEINLLKQIKSNESI